MRRVGFVGWRGMVGSVLMQRMHTERDFALIEPVFFSTSRVGQMGPFIGKESAPLKDANSVTELAPWTWTFTAKGATTRTEFFRSCALRGGRVTGSTRPRRYACGTMP